MVLGKIHAKDPTLNSRNAFERNHLPKLRLGSIDNENFDNDYGA